MSVVLSIHVKENCESLHIFDQTGKYHPKCNKTGWCKPNTDISEAVDAEFRLTPPGSDEPFIIKCSPTFPSTDIQGLEVLPADIGAEKFVSGVWKFEYFVTLADGTLLTQSCYKLLTKDILCCLEGKTVSTNTENFQSDQVKESNNLNNLFKSAEANAKLGKIKETQDIVDFLYVKCKCKC